MEGEAKAPRPGRAAAWIVAAAAVVIAGAWIAIPGIDAEVLEAAQALAGTEAWLGTTMLPLIGMSVWALVGVRVALAILGKSESGPARSIAFVLCGAIAAGQTLSLALWAESASGAMLFGDLVREPGWRFRLTAMITSAAGAAVLWWIADRVDATRAATGALALALPASLLQLVREIVIVADGLAHGMVAPLEAAVVLVLPLSMAVAATALALRTPARWPVKVVGTLELRSGFDVVTVPAGVAALFSIVGSSAGPSFVRAGVVALGTAGLVVLLRARVRERAPRRTLWPFAIALSALAIAVVPMGVSAVASGALRAAVEPGPLAGEASYTITLAAVEELGDGEAQAMVDRLNTLGASAELVSADARRVRIRVANAAPADEVLAALRPRTLAIHLVRHFPDVPLPLGVARRTGSPEGPCETVRAWAPSIGCTSAIEPIEGVDELGMTEADRDPQCRVHCLEDTPIVTASDVVDAWIGEDPMTGVPYVSGRLREDAAARFERVTGENVEGMLAIVIDGEVASAPTIRGAVPGGEFQITLGSLRAPEEVLEEANELVWSLRAGGAIRSEWTLEAME